MCSSDLLNEAIAAANGKTITLLSDVNVGKGIVLAAGTSITLDLNGKTISGTAAPFFTVNNSTLTIFDGKSGGKLDGSGVQGTFVGDLPTQCAAMNMTNINVQLLTIEAAMTLKRERIYQAAMLDPHTAAELSIDDIIKMCDELIAAHGDLLPKYI